MKHIFRPWRMVGLLAMFLLGFLLAVALRGPYFWPTGVALGPCLPDYTSPTTWRGERASPLRSTAFTAGNTRGLICYGSPSARGREVYGNLVPQGSLWRLGANEPTRLFVDGPLDFGGLSLDAGRYSLYALPDSTLWTIFVSESTNHWGNMITRNVREQEIGSVQAPVLPSGTFVESFTVTFSEPPGDTAALVFEWADRQVPVTLATP